MLPDQALPEGQNPTGQDSASPAASLVGDFVQRDRLPLSAFFTPRRVAVIGASERKGSVGWALMTNLLGSSFGGSVIPVNAKRAEVLGVKAYPELAAIPDHVDLAVI